MKYTVNEIIKDIDNIMSTLNEAYIFNDDDRMDGHIEEPMEDEPIGHEQMQDPMAMQNQDQGINLAKKDKRIIQMRELALQGLQDYAQEVDNPFYEFYKKVWLETDKMCDNKEVAK